MLARVVYDTEQWTLVPRVPTLEMVNALAYRLHPIDMLLGQDARARGKLLIPRIYDLEVAAGQYTRMLSLVPGGARAPLHEPVVDTAVGGGSKG